MDNWTPGDSLEKLPADLRHCEKSADFGENPTVIEIKIHLLRRIAELESALRQTAPLQATATPTKEQ
jgi:hypothetical protein